MQQVRSEVGYKIAKDGEQRLEDQAFGEDKAFVDYFLGGETIDESLDKEAHPRTNDFVSFVS